MLYLLNLRTILLLVLFLSSLYHSFISAKSLNIQERLFYIYPWPTELNDVYPPFNATLHREAPYNHAFHDNNGLGLMLDKDIGLFQTWQFSLYQNIMQRLRVSPLRTYDPEKATAFIIPFDCGVHSYIDHVDGRKRFASPHGWTAKMLLESSPYMKRNGGHDHWVIFSITLYSMIGVASKVFYQSICYNCSTLVIETSPTFLKGFSDWPYKQYWHAVPYPASYHWHEEMKQLPWTLSTSSTVQSSSRNIFVLFIGSVRTATVSANRFRKVLQTQCQQAESLYQKSSTTTNQYSSFCAWYPVVHSCQGIINATEQMKLFTQSVFCPAPVGDSLTRKSLFDALVAGCIPVIFDELSLSQYAWHISEEERQQISVFIPKQNVSDSERSHANSTSFISILRSISSAEIRMKQMAIAKIAARLQYSLVPSHAREGEDQPRWKPPFPDAVSIIEERVVDPLTVQPVDNSIMQDAIIRAKCLRKDGNGVVQDGVVFSRGLAWHRLKQLCSTGDVTIDMYDGAIIDLRNSTMKREYEAYLKIAQKQRDLERKMLKQKQKSKSGKMSNSVT